jgi:hypothetical protein
VNNAWHAEGLRDSQGPQYNGAVGMVVIGSYRSGTSVATRIVNLLGMPITHCSDLVPPAAANPTGFWESALMNRHNEWLLQQVGSSWCRPPCKEKSDQLLVRDEWLSASRDLFRHVHRTRRWVWKEPRLCLTLPWWRKALPEISMGILMLRHPLECAASSQEFLGVDEDWGLAIWERYMRQALPGLAGLRVTVSKYESLQQAPLLWGEKVLEMLSETGLQAPPRWRNAVGNLVRRKSSRSAESLSRRLPIDILELWAQLKDLEGSHPIFPDIKLASESSWTTDLLSRRRFGSAAIRGARASRSSIEAQPFRRNANSKPLLTCRSESCRGTGAGRDGLRRGAMPEMIRRWPTKRPGIIRRLMTRSPACTRLAKRSATGRSLI